MATQKRTYVAAAVAAVLIMLPLRAAAFRGVEPGAAMPDFALTDLAGASKTSADFAGKAKIILFFSGNDRSKKVLGELGPIADKFAADGLVILGIYTGSDRAEAKTLAEGAKVAYPVLLDTDKAYYGAVGVSVTPVMALVGTDGKLSKEQPYVPLLSGILEVETKVILGKLSRADADLSLKPEEAPVVSATEKEAEKEYNLGLVLLERGMRDKAMEKFKKVIEIDPSYCKVRVQLGQLYIETGKIDEAKTEFEYVLKCDPTSAEAKVGMGTVLGAKGEHDKAIEILLSSLALNPRPELANYELGKIYEKKGQLDKAIESYKKALERLLSK
jgi:peroxiredoxin/predicted negative regulator of RcsB-dependent stress response